MNRLREYPLSFRFHVRSRLKLVYRWLTPRDEKAHCYDCTVDLSHCRPPHLRITHVTQSTDQLTIRPQPLCGTCWLIYEKTQGNP